jgi:hypothetical protein
LAELPFLVFDADNHYYEALDAFTRHLEPGTPRASPTRRATSTSSRASPPRRSSW